MVIGRKIIVMFNLYLRKWNSIKPLNAESEFRPQSQSAIQPKSGFQDNWKAQLLKLYLYPPPVFCPGVAGWAHVHRDEKGSVAAHSSATSIIGSILVALPKSPYTGEPRRCDWWPNCINIVDVTSVTQSGKKFWEIGKKRKLKMYLPLHTQWFSDVIVYNHTPSCDSSFKMWSHVACLSLLTLEPVVLLGVIASLGKWMMGAVCSVCPTVAFFWGGGGSSKL